MSRINRVKKILGNIKACEHFEGPKELEIDDNGYLGKELINLKNARKLNIDSIETAALLNQIEKIDFKGEVFRHFEYMRINQLLFLI